MVESQNEDEEIKEQIDVDHDYCFQTLSAGEDVEDIKENICDLDQAVETSTGNNNIKIEYYDLSTFDNNGEIKEDNSSSYPMETLEEFLQNNDEGNLEEDIGEIENCASSLNKIPTVTNLEDDTYQKTKVKEKESFSCLTCLEM